MPRSLTTVQLSRIGQPPLAVPVAHPQGRLFYLPHREVIVAVECRVRDGWRCRIIGRRDNRMDTSHTHVADEEIAVASTTITVDPIADPDGYGRLVSPVQIWQRWPGGRIPIIGNLLAGELRKAGTLTVDLTPYAISWLMLHAHVRPAVLRLLLTRLINAQLPSVDRSEPDHWRAVSITVPRRVGRAISLCLFLHARLSPRRLP